MVVGMEVCTAVGVQVGMFTGIIYLFFQHNKTKQVNIPLEMGGLEREVYL